MVSATANMRWARWVWRFVTKGLRLGFMDKVSQTLKARNGMSKKGCTFHSGTCFMFFFQHVFFKNIGIAQVSY